MIMKLYQLRYFTAVCRYGYVTRAAEELHVTQPSVSNAIKELEDEFSVNLFHRINNRLSPTREGLYFLDQATKILELSEATQSRMEELGSRKRQIKIGIPPMIGTFIFPGMFSAFRGKYPNASLEMVEGGSPDSLLAVENDDIDLAVIITNGIKKPDIHIEPLCSTEFMFCVGREHPLAGRGRVTFEDIKNEDLILFTNGSFQNGFVRSRFAAINAEPRVVLYSNQIITMKNLVRECGVCAFLIRDVVKNDSGLSAIPIDPPIPIEIGVIWRKNKRHSSDTIQFIKFVNEMKNTFVSG